MRKPFSQIYLENPQTKKDDKKFRLRLASLILALIDRDVIDSVSLGKQIEYEIGVRIVETNGWGDLFVDWDDFFKTGEIEEILDTLFWAVGRVSKRDGKAAEVFVSEVERIFRERGLAYRIDQSGTVHPFVDAEFERLSSELIAKVSVERYSTARTHVETAERAMLQSSPDHRLAMRAVFDAVENVFKLIDPKSTQLNNSAIQSKIKPLVFAMYEAGSVEMRLASKNIDVLRAWVEGLHNYRHADGSEQPKQPSQSSMVLAVSVGYALLRWLIEIDASRG